MVSVLVPACLASSPIFMDVFREWRWPVDLEVALGFQMMPSLGDCHETHQRITPFSRYRSMWMSDRVCPESGARHSVCPVEPIDDGQRPGNLAHSRHGLPE